MCTSTSMPATSRAPLDVHRPPRFVKGCRETKICSSASPLSMSSFGSASSMKMVPSPAKASHSASTRTRPSCPRKSKSLSLDDTFGNEAADLAPKRPSRGRRPPNRAASADDVFVADAARSPRKGRKELAVEDDDQSISLEGASDSSSEEETSSPPGSPPSRPRLDKAARRMGSSRRRVKGSPSESKRRLKIEGASSRSGPAYNRESSRRGSTSSRRFSSSSSRDLSSSSNHSTQSEHTRSSSSARVCLLDDDLLARSLGTGSSSKHFEDDDLEAVLGSSWSLLSTPRLKKGKADRKPSTADFSRIAQTLKHQEDKPTETAAVPVTITRQQQREQERQQRIQRVRDRLSAEQAQEEERKRLAAEAKLIESDSPKARRERAYRLYYKLAMPNREAFKKKIAKQKWGSTLGQRDGVTVADVDLLPWTSTGSMVNVAKLHTLL